MSYEYPIGNAPAHNHQNTAGGGTLDAAAIASGTLATARLGSGAASSSTVLLGNQTWSARGKYAVQASAAALSPSPSTTYYFGRRFASAPSTTALLAAIIAPDAGTITSVSFVLGVDGTLSSSETFSVYIRVDNTTDHLVTSSARMDFASFSVVTPLSISVASGANLEVKIVTPAWSVNPTNVHLSAVILIS